LFRHKGNLLSGDITPAYSELEEDVISEFARVLPDTKAVLIVRDPVSRACSHNPNFIAAENAACAHWMIRKLFTIFFRLPAGYRADRFRQKS
jgi:hypothetical protein